MLSDKHCCKVQDHTEYNTCTTANLKQPVNNCSFHANQGKSNAILNYRHPFRHVYNDVKIDGTINYTDKILLALEYCILSNSSLKITFTTLQK